MEGNPSELIWIKDTLNPTLPTDFRLSGPFLLTKKDLYPRSDKKLPRRPMNAFFIFTKELDKRLRLKGHCNVDRQTKARFAADLWKKESSQVKAECQRLANIAKQILKEMTDARVHRNESLSNYSNTMSRPLTLPNMPQAYFQSN